MTAVVVELAPPFGWALDGPNHDILLDSLAQSVRQATDDETAVVTTSTVESSTHRPAIVARLDGARLRYPRGAADVLTSVDTRTVASVVALALVQSHGIAWEPFTDAIELVVGDGGWAELVRSVPDGERVLGDLRESFYADTGIRLPPFTLLEDAAQEKGTMTVGVGALRLGPLDAWSPEDVVQSLRDVLPWLRGPLAESPSMQGLDDEWRAIFPALSLIVDARWGRERGRKVLRTIAARQVSIRDLYALYGQMATLEPQSADEEGEIDRLADEVIRWSRRSRVQRDGAAAGWRCLTLDPSCLQVADALPEEDAGDRLVTAISAAVEDFDADDIPPIVVPNHLASAVATLMSVELPQVQVYASSELDEVGLDVVAVIFDIAQ